MRRQRARNRLNNWPKQLVLADTRERSETVARSKLVANSATPDTSLANSRIRAIKRVELFGLSEGDVRTLPQGRRDATGEQQTRNGVGVAVEVAHLSSQCRCTRLSSVTLSAQVAVHSSCKVTPSQS